MDILPATKKYTNHRFPIELISHAVWLYLWVCLSFRAVEELLGFQEQTQDNVRLDS